MKKCLTLALTGLFLFSACKKESKSDQPNTTTSSVFSKAAYEKLCAWDVNGRPDCLMTRDVITQDLLNFINYNLPEGKDLRTTNPALFSGTSTAEIAVGVPSDVFITFVAQSTNSHNSFGYYTYPTGQPPRTADDVKKLAYVFPNVKSASPLMPGDKVKLGRFEAGTSIGFVLLQNAWSFASKQPNNNAVHFCSTDALNPEADVNLKKHAVLIDYPQERKLLIGFDDALRTSPACDHDFNDVVLYATLVQ